MARRRAVDIPREGKKGGVTQMERLLAFCGLFGTNADPEELCTTTRTRSTASKDDGVVVDAGERKALAGRVR